MCGQQKILSNLLIELEKKDAAVAVAMSRRLELAGTLFFEIH
jgi:hypothetical protein